MENTASASASEDQEVLAFSLTDPERLTTQLDAANLDEEETELLLEEALKLNARLKEVLRHQQLDTGETSSAGKARGSGRGMTGASGGHSRQTHPLEEQFIRRQPQGKPRLPPIGSGGSPGEGTSVKHKHGKGSKSGANDEIINSVAGPRPPSSRRRQGSGKKRIRHVDNRPAWDDRFCFD
ncbi:hypothetical protein PoB_004977700 [Plakobranchus ocellatus]|uniref:Uncharacterized protein n=1 Tax=Plakobranchus ocellatus TaxID=259542 RepID=A0AAV4BVT2_9GAST|nr:hypothetical protein PoB_004977700 [Plakobranchus ocellatus]